MCLSHSKPGSSAFESTLLGMLQSEVWRSILQSLVRGNDSYRSLMPQDKTSWESHGYAWARALLPRCTKSDYKEPGLGLGCLGWWSFLLQGIALFCTLIVRQRLSRESRTRLGARTFDSWQHWSHLSICSKVNVEVIYLVIRSVELCSSRCSD